MEERVGRLLQVSRVSSVVQILSITYALYKERGWKFCAFLEGVRGVGGKILTHLCQEGLCELIRDSAGLLTKYLAHGGLGKDARVPYISFAQEVITFAGLWLV